MHQNYYAVRGDESVGEVEHIVAIFQDRDDARAFMNAVRDKARVTLYTKSALVAKYKQKDGD